MDTEFVVGSLVAFALTSVLLWILEPVAQHIGLVDRPGGRKAHDRPTPLVGGIAMFIAFAFSILAFNISLSSYRMLFAGALLLVVVGVLDDLRELSSRQRFGAQIIAGLLMTLGAGVVLEDVGRLITPDSVIPLGILAVPVTVFATVGVTNAVNMIDGLDGLAGALVLVTVGALAVVAWAAGDAGTVSILLLLAAVLLAFLVVNLRPGDKALVFMGDAGSMFLGFVLAWFLVKFSQGEERLLAPVTALWIFALPLVNTVSMMLRRMLLGRSPFLADREHVHDILVAAGFTPKQTLALMSLLALAGAGVGLVGHFAGIPEQWMFFGFLGLFALHFYMIMRAWRMKRFLTRQLLHKPKASADERLVP